MFDNYYTVVTLCGSTRFKEAFIEANKRLTLEGKVVFSVGVFGHTDMPELMATAMEDVKVLLDEIHKQKIRMSDAIHVINPGGYIGESTAKEIAYARSLGRRVTYMTDAVIEGSGSPEAARKILGEIQPEMERGSGEL